MTEHQLLKQLSEATGVVLSAEQAKLAQLTTKEQRIRSALRKLAEHRVSSRELPSEQLASLRHIGADLTWDRWIGRNQTDLNRELALCLVEKANLMSGLKRAFHRNTSANQMLENENADLQSMKARKTQQSELDAILLQATRPAAQYR